MEQKSEMVKIEGDAARGIPATEVDIAGLSEPAQRAWRSMSESDRTLVEEFVETKNAPREHAVYAVWRARAGQLIRAQRACLEASNFVAPERIPPGILREMVESGRRKPLGRNSRCPCGSGKRFKRCCMK